MSTVQQNADILASLVKQALAKLKAEEAGIEAPTTEPTVPETVTDKQDGSIKLGLSLEVGNVAAQGTETTDLVFARMRQEPHLCATGGKLELVVPDPDGGEPSVVNIPPSHPYYRFASQGRDIRVNFEPNSYLESLFGSHCWFRNVPQSTGMRHKVWLPSDSIRGTAKKADAADKLWDQAVTEFRNGNADALKTFAALTASSRPKRTNGFTANRGVIRGV